jgi:hypothetical protein
MYIYIIIISVNIEMNILPYNIKETLYIEQDLREKAFKGAIFKSDFEKMIISDLHQTNETKKVRENFQQMQPLFQATFFLYLLKK